MNILFIGDITGRTGREAVYGNLAKAKERYFIDLCIANAENSAGGSGITRDIYDELHHAGIDAFTMGNHVWSKKDILTLFSYGESIIRPANYPEGTPGSGMIILSSKDGTKCALINLMGRTFMENIDCPFKCADALVEEAKKVTPIIFVDFHAEATSEKVALGWYLDGRVSAVVGTHTHVQTADERILPHGTAYITDVGMTGARNSCLGVSKDIAISRFITKMPKPFEMAKGEAQFNAVVVNIDDLSGKSLNIERIFW